MTWLRRNLNLNLILALAVVLGAAALVLAQEAAPGPPVPKPDWMAEIVLAIVILTPIVVRVLTWGAFLVVDRIPKWALPTGAVVLATLFDFLSGLAVTDPILASVVTLATVGLREIIDRLFTQPLNLHDSWTYTDGPYLRRRT